MTDNPRGYAFQALTKAYDRSMRWSTFAALAKDGLMPSKYEYIEDGLRMFDSYDIASATIIEAKAIIDTIIKEMGRSLTEQLKGKHSYPTDSEGVQYIVTRYDSTLDLVIGNDQGEDITLGTSVPELDKGYAAVEDADEMRYRMRMLADRLRPADMATLASYVSGEYETLTEACGGRTQYQLFTRRMKVATRGMVMA